MDIVNMMEQEKLDMLELLMFLEEKRDGNIKGRDCADRHKQQKGLSK